MSETVWTIEDIVNIESIRKVRRVPMPEWATNGSTPVVCLTPCSSADWDEHEAALVMVKDSRDASKARGWRAKLVAKCMCNEDGVRMTIKPAHLARLSAMPPLQIAKLYEAARAVCGDTEGYDEGDDNGA